MIQNVGTCPQRPTLCRAPHGGGGKASRHRPIPRLRPGSRQVGEVQSRDAHHSRGKARPHRPGGTRGV